MGLNADARTHDIRHPCSAQASPRHGRYRLLADADIDALNVIDACDAGMPRGVWALLTRAIG